MNRNTLLKLTLYNKVYANSTNTSTNTNISSESNTSTNISINISTNPISRDGDDDILNSIFPQTTFIPPVLPSKFLKRDYQLFNVQTEDQTVYEYGIFGVYSTFNDITETRIMIVRFDRTELDSINCDSIDNTSNRFSTVPTIDYIVTDECPTEFIDRIFEYEFGSSRPFNVNNKLIVERDDLIDINDTNVTTTIQVTENKTDYDPVILDLYYRILNNNYISTTDYSTLVETITVMINI